jgi:hypothetical protein
MDADSGVQRDSILSTCPIYKVKFCAVPRDSGGTQRDLESVTPWRRRRRNQSRIVFRQTLSLLLESLSSPEFVGMGEVVFRPRFLARL